MNQVGPLHSTHHAPRKRPPLVQRSDNNVQTIDIANKLGANFSSGDPQVDAAAQEGKPSADAFGNKGQDGQYGQQGQYGAVTGQGFGAGAGLAKDAQGQSLAAGQGQPTAGRKHRDSAYEGMEHGDSAYTSPLFLCPPAISNVRKGSRGDSQEGRHRDRQSW